MHGGQDQDREIVTKSGNSDESEENLSNSNSNSNSIQISSSSSEELSNDIEEMCDDENIGEDSQELSNASGGRELGSLKIHQ